MKTSTTKINLTGYFYVVHSPDDEDECGKGWYATVYVTDTKTDQSPLFHYESQAEAYARKHGGVRRVD